jgi:beta-mannosidase
MEQTLQTWRRAGSACHGALIWFWKDLREGAGWGVVDAHGQAKAAYYYLKRSMAAQTAFLTDEGLNGLTCHVVNDSAQTMRGTLTLRLLRLPSSTTAEVSLPLELAPHSQWQQRADALLPYFMDTAYAYRFGPVSHQVAAVHWQAEDDAAGSIAGYAFPAGHVLPAESQASVTLQVVDQTAQQVQIRLCSDRFRRRCICRQTACSAVTIISIYIRACRIRCSCPAPLQTPVCNRVR